MRVPSATYRLQLTADFPFDAARQLLPYLESLGVSDLYVSPVLQSRAGSMHGYDVTDPTRVRDELGGEDGLVRLADEAHGRDMGLLIDVVPNHVAASIENPWWENVLRYGPASRYAAAFDIDWEPARPGLAGKVLLPVLTSHYGEALEGGEFKLALGEDGLGVSYGGLRLPLSPRSQATVLGWGLARLERAAGPASPAVLELAAIVDELASTGPHAAEGASAATTRLLRLIEQDATVSQHAESRIRRWNGTVGEPRTFDPMDRLLDAQSYRVVHWPVADQEINYRRFFDVNDLVAVRAEDEGVFWELLGTLIRLVRSGVADGLRIDHVDGLHDPARFLERLRGAVGPETYLVVEKILASDEDLRPWPVQGSTGYELLNAVNDVFIDPGGLRRLEAIVAAGADGRASADEVYAAKRLAVTELFGGELRNLAQRLGRLAEQHRHGRDLTLTELGRALVGVTACLGVYRTYVDSFNVEGPDRLAIEAAVEEAIRRDPDAGRATRFMRHVLLLDLPARAGPPQRALWLRFVMRWQQLTSAAMAKGKEDTAFYRRVRLLARNEVGGDPGRPPIGVADLHDRMRRRAERWPHALSASSTHDTKRGEDVRARIDALSELPDETSQHFGAWRRWCEERVGAAAQGLGADALLLIFQTLIGAWPLIPDPAFGDRIAAYAVKAAREAKRETSWRRPNDAYETALAAVARAIVDAEPSDRERQRLAAFADRVAVLGARGSLAQKLLTIGLPGVPDVYQGTELWDLSLVDPDNRRPVDYAHRREVLAQLDSAAGTQRRALASDLMEHWRDGRVKLYVTATALRLRRAHRRLYESGRYIALEAAGARAEHVVAFAREHAGEWAATVVPRVGGTIDDWGDTSITFPSDAPRSWEDALSSATHEVSADRLRVADLLRDLPVALLVGTAA